MSRRLKFLVYYPERLAFLHEPDDDDDDDDDGRQRKGGGGGEVWKKGRKFVRHPRIFDGSTPSRAAAAAAPSGD